MNSSTKCTSLLSRAERTPQPIERFNASMLHLCKERKQRVSIVPNCNPQRKRFFCFLTGISVPPNHQVHVISRRLCSGWLRPGSVSAHVCSGLLTHLARHHQLLTRGPERPPFPARDPKSVPTALSQPVPARTYSQTVIPVCPSSCKMPCFKAFDVVLCGLPGAWYYINGCLPLAFTSFLSHLLTHLLAHLLTHLLTLFPSSSIEDVLAARPPPGRKFRIMDWADGVLDDPVFPVQ